MKKSLLFTLLASALFLSGCIYEAPITEKPTGKIDGRLVGDWVIKEQGKEEQHMVVTKLNDREYIVNYEGVYRAFHTDVDGVRFVSAQDIVPLQDSERKYVFLTWELKDDGKKLVMHTVNQHVISDKLHTSEEILKAIKANLKNPDLFNKEAGIFTKVR